MIDDREALLDEIARCFAFAAVDRLIAEQQALEVTPETTKPEGTRPPSGSNSHQHRESHDADATSRVRSRATPP